MIALLLAWVYYRYRSLSVIQGVLGGVRPAVVAMIASAGLSILLLALFGSEVISLPLLDLRALGIFALAFGSASHFQARSHLGDGRGRRAGRYPVLSVKD